MHVDNASDLYSQEYVEKFKLLRNSKEPLILPNSLADYYNSHFNRLGMINFLPFYSNDFDELKRLMLHYNGFTKEDTHFFVKPFLAICESESDFYFKFWTNTIHTIKEECVQVENILKEKLNLYRCIFEYYNKSALALLSLSVTRNGRGSGGIENCFSALIPFPKSLCQIDNSFFILLHEYTHQITDELLGSDIHMNDGSHDISENVVILFDFYLLKFLNEADAEKYLKWIAEKSGYTGNAISETTFLSVFNVDNFLKDKMHTLLHQIISKTDVELC